MDNRNEVPMPTLPTDWPQLSSAVFYDDAHAAIAWLCEAFGFEVGMVVEGENGEVIHSELDYGRARIMVGSTNRPKFASPRTLGGKNTQSVFIYVEDVDQHCARARAHGAVIVDEPKDSDYGEDLWADRSYGCEDLEGHHWWFSHRVRSRA